jgi:large subunit ribosomal protein L21
MSISNFSQEGYVMYAVMKSGGKQYRVSEGDLLRVDKIEGEKGDTVTFEEVLMVSKDGGLAIGTPLVKGAKVVGEIMDQARGPKIFVFKMKRRKGYRKKTGHRQELTGLKIKEIVA